MTAYIAPGILAPEEVIAQHWQTTVAEMTDRNRKRHNVEARQVAMWYMVTRQDYTLAQAGHVMQRDHVTVLYARNQVNNLILVDKVFRKKVALAVEQIEKITAKSNNE